MSKNRMLVGYSIVAITLGMCACARRTTETPTPTETPTITPTPTETPIVLENRFTKGEELRYKMTMRGSGTTSIAGLPGQRSGVETPVKLQMELAYRMVVKDADAQGNADLETHFERFTSTTESGTLKIQMEADEKGARIVQGETVVKDAPGLDGLKALFKNPTLIKMDKRGKVLSITQPKGVVELLPHVNIYSLLKQNQFILPEGPIAIGGSWSEKRDIALGGGLEEKLPAAKALKLDTTYTLAGLVKRDGRRCAEIALRGEVAAKEMEMDLPQRQGSDMAMKAAFDRLRQTMVGNIYFDPQRGLMVGMHVDTDQDMAMTMKITKGETETIFSTTTRIKMETDLKLLE
ncbi:MAG: hypothetical protein NTX71_12495 [Candidatus Aureabacteria bacterium]|nr:hypothetical protein [Candidatus Auribacterota bacterium]